MGAKKNFDYEQFITNREELEQVKSTGVVRKIDELGRVVLPMELRRTMGIAEKDPLEIFTEEDRIVLRKYTPGCSFCGNPNELSYVMGKAICGKCAEQIVKVIGKVKA